MVNKGQVKIQQMAFMILGLTLFFILVGMFVLSYFLSDLGEKKNALKEEEATVLALSLANSAEFSCGGAFGTVKTNCIDLDKLFALKEKADDYKILWGVDGIEILRLSPEFENECTDANYPDCSILKVVESEKGIDKSAFVSVCYKAKIGTSFYDKCEIGKLVVRVENA